MAAPRPAAVLAPLTPGVTIYLFVGAGGIGSSVAARLAGYAETAIMDGWTEHVAAIRAAGLRLSLPDGDVVVRVPAWAYGEARTLPSDVDAVLLSVKSYDTEETLDRLLPMLPAGVPVVSLQNGLNEVAIAEAVGADRTVGAVVMFDGVLVAPGHVRTRRPEAPLTIGAWGSADVSRLAATLGQAVPTVVSDDIRADLWGKLVVNCMLNAPAAAAGLGLRDLVHADAGPTACAEVAREAVTVASRCGIAVPPESLYGVDPIAHPEEFAQTVVRTFADSELRPSMLTDVERGRRTEIDALNGVVVAEGRRLGVDTPWNTHFREVVTRIEHGAAQPDERWLRP